MNKHEIVVFKFLNVINNNIGTLYLYNRRELGVEKHETIPFGKMKTFIKN